MKLINVGLALDWMSRIDPTNGSNRLHSAYIDEKREVHLLNPNCLLSMGPFNIAMLTKVREKWIIYERRIK